MKKQSEFILLNEWQPQKEESRLLKGYVREVNCSLLALEVPIGLSQNWGLEAQTRYIDGVLLFEEEEKGDPTQVKRVGHKELNSLIEYLSINYIELVEIKEKLNRPVIGQAIAGEVMFKKDYPKMKEINKVVVCKEADSALMEVCNKLNIKVVQIN